MEYIPKQTSLNKLKVLNMKSQIVAMILAIVIIFAVLLVAITSTVIGISALILASVTIILFLAVVTNLISLLIDGVDSQSNEKDDTRLVVLENGAIVEYYNSYLNTHEVEEYKY